MAALRKKVTTREELLRLQKKLQLKAETNSTYLAVCGDTGCAIRGSRPLKDLFLKALEQRGLTDRIGLKFTGCLGLCEAGPVAIVYPGEIFYQKVRETDVDDIIEKTLLGGEIIDRLLYRDPVTGEVCLRLKDIPFYKKQQQQLLGLHRKIDPTRVEDYLALGGYLGAARALFLKPLTVIEEVKESRLRGRGGAGFPVGLKWEECFEVPSREKYIICNADEGDPGAFMDRSLLEGNPHSILEGMLIGGYAVGASEGIVYIRSEYPTAVAKVRQAVVQAEELGLLGENILGSGFTFRITLSVGAGAFVCGETSALVSSVEGRVGEPRQKPPHLAERGYKNKPTVINNVESLANIPRILRYGAEDFSRLGTEKSRGTKIFSLVGKVRQTGLVEVPLGMTLREIIFDIGGGIQGDRKFKAVQTGGPSGGCLPEGMLDSPTDYEELAAAGSMMGSGGMIVMDEDTCMVDIARYFLGFLKDESCGCCFSCREGISRMLDMVEDIAAGRGSLEQLALLEELAAVVRDSTLCGLGQTSANPVLSTLRYFEGEYLAHILEKKCPAGVCRPLLRFCIDENLCTGCGACRKICPSGAVLGEKKEPHRVDGARCVQCGMCLEVCAFKAVIKQ